MTQGYTEEECKNALRRAARELGESPTVPEYRELGFEPSDRTLSKKFGSWPEAKRAAGLDAIKHGENEAFLESQFESKKVDSGYFDEIDTVEKAYWLGFLLGDGSVRERTAGGRALALELQLTDREHVELFKETVQSDHTLYERENCIMIQIGDREFVDNLWDKGITSSKTRDGRLPSVGSEYRPALTRGLFDADGSVRAVTSGYRWVITSSSRERLDRLTDWLPVPTVITSHTQKPAFQLGVYQIDHLSRLVQWLYPDGKGTEPSLSRKMDIALRLSN